MVFNTIYWRFLILAYCFGTTLFVSLAGHQTRRVDVQEDAQTTACNSLHYITLLYYISSQYTDKPGARTAKIMHHKQTTCKNCQVMNSLGNAVAEHSVEAKSHNMYSQ